MHSPVERSASPQPTPKVELATLGGLAITRAGQPMLGLPSRKAEALLVYLACTAKPHARDLLLALLWADATPERGRNNLSVLLTSLRQHFGAALVATRQTVALEPSAVSVDALEMTKQLARPGGRSVLEIERGLALYGGPFLHGFSVRDSPGFEAWMFAEQTRLRQLVLAAGETLVQQHIAARAYAQGLARATALLGLEPLHEALQRQALLLLAYTGQRAAAIAQYDGYRRQLIDELGIEPTPETGALYARIVKGDLVVPAAPVAPAPVVPIVPVAPIAVAPPVPMVRGLPFQPTALLGRTAEVAALAAQLADPDCRLLTLIGPGGTGKTRLVVAAAERLVGHFADGATFVALAATAAPAQISTEIAEAVGCPVHGRADPTAQLQAWLRPKHMLLVLDNWEHLVAGADMLNALLAQAPRLVILATSRVRLGLQAEWLYDVGGLQYPSAAWSAAAPASDAEEFSAVQLFMRQARRIAPQLRWNAESAPHVVRICQAVEGLPLGLELAAAQVRTLAIATIADKLTATLTDVVTSLRDVTPRHRSLRAVFVHSWALLAPEAQQVLAQLSVFRGGFTLAAALAVCIADAAQDVETALIGLGDASLLRQAPDGRYDMHPLVQQFAAERLFADAALATTVRQQHAEYMLALVAAEATALEGATPQHAGARLRTELDNVRHGWEGAVQVGLFGAIGDAARGLARFYLLAGLLVEGIGLFGVAARHLARSSEPAAVVVRAKILAEHAYLLTYRGQYEQAQLSAAAAVALAAPLPAVEAVEAVEADARLAWGKAALGLNDHAQAQTQFAQALVLAQRLAQPRLVAWILREQGRLAEQTGQYVTAQSLLDDALALFRRVHDRRGESLALNNLGVIAEERGDYLQARLCYEQVLALQHAIADRHGTSYTLANLGVVAHGQGQYAEAAALHQQSLSIFREVGDRMSEGISLNNLGDIASGQGDWVGAQQAFTQSLAIRRELGDRMGESYTLAGLSLLQRRLGAWAQSLAFALEAQALAHAVQAQSPEATALSHAGHALAALGRLDEAHTAHATALALRQQMGEGARELESHAGLAHVALALGDAPLARTHILPILAHLEQQPLVGCEEPFQVYLICREVLRANGDPRAAAVFAAARALLHSHAAHIADPQLRHSFLHAVPVNRTLGDSTF